MKQIDWDSGKLPASAVTGGYHAVKTHEDMEEIPEENRQVGMMVCVLDEQSMYVLMKSDVSGGTYFENVSSFTDVTDREIQAIFEPESKENPGPTEDA